MPFLRKSILFFLLAIPVFFLGIGVQIFSDLRLQLDSGTVTGYYVLLLIFLQLLILYGWILWKYFAAPFKKVCLGLGLLLISHVILAVYVALPMLAYPPAVLDNLIALLLLSLWAFSPRLMGAGNTDDAGGVLPIRTILFWLVVVLLALAPRLYHLSYQSIWMDEDAQAAFSLNGPVSPRVTSAAAWHGQPALGYHIEAVSLRNFGITPRGARLPSVLAGVLVVVCLAGLSRSTLRRTSLQISVILCAALNVWLITYSQEGRSIMLGVALASVYLWFMHRALFVRERPRRDALLLAVVIQVFLLLSVGFQPLVLLFTAVCCYPLYALYAGRWRWRSVLLVACSALLSVILVAPVFLGFFATSNADLYLGAEGQSDSVPGLLQKWTSGWAYILPFFELGGGLVLAGICAVMMLVALVWMRQIKTAGERPVPGFQIWILLISFVFPPVFFMIYTTLVDYPLYHRYILVIFPVWCLGIHYAVEMLMDLLPRRVGLFRWVLILPVWITLAASIFELPNYYNEPRRRDWRGFYGLLVEKGEMEDVAFKINLIKPGEWDSDFWSHRFYYVPRHPVPLLTYTDMEGVFKYFDQNDPASTFMLCMFGEEALSPELEARVDGVRYHKLNRLSVLHIDRKGPWLDRLGQVFTAWRDVLPPGFKRDCLDRYIALLAERRSGRLESDQAAGPDAAENQL